MSSGNVRIIRDTRLEGLAVLAKRVKEGDRPVFVGVPKTAGNDDEGVTVAMVAAVNEFGSSDGRIPERSFLRNGILSNLPQLRQISADGISRVARGGLTVKNVLRRMGAAAAGGVQQFIVKGAFTPNAPSTIKKKGSSQPLIDDGQLRQSITWTFDGDQAGGSP